MVNGKKLIKILCFLTGIVLYNSTSLAMEKIIQVSLSDLNGNLVLQKQYSTGYPLSRQVQ